MERSPNWPGQFGFAGYRYNSQALIYNLVKRDNHPHLGRFLEPDPAGLIDGTNLYTYAHNSPGTLIDYWGSDSTSGFNWGNIGRAAGTIATGAVAVAGGAALLSNPIGWFALGGAMLLGSGAAGLGMGLVLLATSQTRYYLRGC